jgi:hypothetical protein
MNKKSKERSYQFIPYTNDILVNSKNFIDIKGNNPLENTCINGKDIVYNKKELKENKWLLLLDNIEIVALSKTKLGLAIKQIKKMICSDTWLVIQNTSPFKIKEIKYNNLYNINDHKNIIELKYIKNKYNTIEECKKDNKEVPSEIIEKFKLGDEILYYNSSPINDNCIYCSHESMILIREDNIICSPIISTTINDFIK